MMKFDERWYTDTVARGTGCLLGVDIGGTNSNFGVFVQDGTDFILICSVHFKSQEITVFVDLVIDVLNYLAKAYGIVIKRACFGAAGVVSITRDYCKPTNLDFALDARELLAHTDLQCAIIVNDFEVIGHGLERVAQRDLVKVKDGRAHKYAARAIIGAGTGLGKCIMHRHQSVERYLPVPSEGGHADFAAQTATELELAEFIRTTENRSCNISWEDVLSGNGIKRIYAFFKQKNNDTSNVQGMHPDEIFNSRNTDKHSWQTFILYTQLYARCVKNFTLDALARNGVYIAGGIASKNVELFQQREFLDEFINCGKQASLLADVPIYVIADYNVSLYGAVAYMEQENMCV